MSKPIDERTAWALIRGLLPVLPEATDTVRTRIRGETSAWLEVDPAGASGWSAPPTVAAKEMLSLFLPLLRRRDLVVAQIGQSLDGRIATVTGDSHYVTGPEDIRRLHRLRALVDAVVVGAGTVGADDPQLTVREVEGENPVRVVLDPNGRLDPKSRVFTDGAAPTLILRRKGEGKPPEDGVIALATPEGRFDPVDVLRVLADRGLRRVLVEGGGITVSRFLEANALDRLHVTVAPLLIGSGRPAFDLEPIERLREGIRPPCRNFRIGEDILFDLVLR